MFHRFHRLPTLLSALLVALLISAPALAEAEEWRERLVDWQILEYQRDALLDRLERLEQEHQRSVRGIENLRESFESGEASRRSLENALRQNMSTVEALEDLQRQLSEVDASREALRRLIVEGIDERRNALEVEIRQAPVVRRMELVNELNELQEQWRHFAAPLPRADQNRIDEALELARQVAGLDPRAMLSAADELEDTEEQLLARLEALDNQIARLEQMRRLHRRSRSFGEYHQFFDEDQRGRTIARFEQASSADSNQAQSGNRGQNGAAGSNGTEQPTFDSGGNDESEEYFDGNQAENVESAPDPGAGQEEAPSDDDMVGNDDVDPFVPDDPFAPEEGSETVTIESQVDPDDADELTGYSERSLSRDLQRLLQERQTLEEQAEELRRAADELRRRAEDSY